MGLVITGYPFQHLCVEQAHAPVLDVLLAQAQQTLKRFVGRHQLQSHCVRNFLVIDLSLNRATLPIGIFFLRPKALQTAILMHQPQLDAFGAVAPVGG